MALKYLMDENVDSIYVNQLRRQKPDLFVLAVGELTAPQLPAFVLTLIAINK